MTTTRFLFILFLLLNILSFAALRSWFDFNSPGVPKEELNPGYVKILGRTPSQENTQADAKGSSDSSPEASEQPTCLSWNGLNTAQNNRLISLLSAAGIQANTRNVQVVSSWRVRVPPLPTREAAEILTENMDVEKSAIQIEEVENNKFAIVLGEPFRNRQSAERYLETMRARGINVDIVPRNATERRVEATVSIERAETLLSGQPFAKRHKPCSP